MNLLNLKQLLAAEGCLKIYVKRLSPNDNSKNQVYLGGSFEIINVLPIKQIRSEEAGDWRRERFKAALDFAWIREDGNIYPAPHAQLILYPKYPEVRFSGFLTGCEKPPSELMAQRLTGRLLFLSVTDKGKILGYVAAADAGITQEFNQTIPDAGLGVFTVIDLPRVASNKSKLLAELYRIHSLDWITAKRLDKNGNVMGCNSPNCGGYTLEAELGIIPNGFAEPDYLGWEIKQFGVKKFTHVNTAVITLMTPEPTDGVYKTDGVEAFLRQYGYADKKGRQDRINFGGIYKEGVSNASTGLKMQLIGFDTDSGKIRSTNGRIALIAKDGREAAAWSFADMIQHWNRKHNQACYVPSLSDTGVSRRYKYGSNVILGTGTDFQLFLQQIASGHIYYDPAIKLENATTKPVIKRRSQFRIKSRYLDQLYKNCETITLLP